MMRHMIPVLLLLAACAAPQPVLSPLRDPAKPMYSTASFNAGKLTGSWSQVAEVTHHPGCGPGQMRVTPTETELVIEWHLCLDGTFRSGQGNLKPAGPGRFDLPGSDLPFWVLWSDADGRTLVLGTPSGAFGIVLDRGTIPADRAKAAADILAWNGYDMGLLHLP